MFLLTYIPLLFAILAPAMPARLRTTTIQSIFANAGEKVHLTTVSGRLFWHVLSSEDFFNQSVPTFFSASAENKPDLPQWLNLALAPNSSIAFLYGSPMIENLTEDILIIAKNKRTYDLAFKKIRINVRFDTRLSHPMTQTAEIWLTNYDLWEFFNSAQQMSELSTAVARSFRGQGVRPYIVDMKPAIQVGQMVPLSENKIGTVIYVATQREKGFPKGIYLLSKGILRHPIECKRNDIVPLDVPFRPKYKIDWCKFRLSNVSRDFAGQGAGFIIGDQLGSDTPPLKINDTFLYVSKFDSSASSSALTSYEHYGSRHYFWDWVMVAAIPTSILLVLLLILSAIFFGCREGQHWRDYKTPQRQLNEYVNLRRTQFNLRMLSLQRQSLDFLDDDAFRAGSLPVGKQTVGDAAALRGSSLLLYENGIDQDERGESAGAKLLPHLHK